MANVFFSRGVFNFISINREFYFHYQSTKDSVNNISLVDSVVDETEPQEIDPNDWRTIYPNPKPIQIGDQEVLASVAETMSERITGLSGTPFA